MVKFLCSGAQKDRCQTFNYLISICSVTDSFNYHIKTPRWETSPGEDMNSKIYGGWETQPRIVAEIS